MTPEEAAARPLRIGSVWRHVRRGTTYTVAYLARDAEVMRHLVVYVSLADELVWASAFTGSSSPGCFRVRGQPV